MIHNCNLINPRMRDHFVTCQIKKGNFPRRILGTKAVRRQGGNRKICSQQVVRIYFRIIFTKFQNFRVKYRWVISCWTFDLLFTHIPIITKRPQLTWNLWKWCSRGRFPSVLLVLALPRQARHQKLDCISSKRDRVLRLGLLLTERALVHPERPQDTFEWCKNVENKMSDCCLILFPQLWYCVVAFLCNLHLLGVVYLRQCKAFTLCHVIFFI